MPASSAQGLNLLQHAGRNGAVAVAFKAADDLDLLATAADRAGIAALVVPSELAWDDLHGLLRTVIFVISSNFIFSSREDSTCRTWSTRRCPSSVSRLSSSCRSCFIARRPNATRTAQGTRIATRNNKARRRGRFGRIIRCMAAF